MLNNARIRLTVTYVLIIMTLSIGFSAVIYKDSIYEAERSFTTQTSRIRQGSFLAANLKIIEEIQQDQLNEIKQRLFIKLLAWNLVMLGAGSLVSYYLAKRSLEPLEEAIVMQSRFTSDAAHELRTPLTAMRSEIEVALRGGKLTVAEAKDLLASNLEEVAKLETLTTALLKLSKSDKPDTKSWNKIKAKALLSTAIKRVSNAAQDKGITIKSDIPSIIFYGDAVQLEEVFVILLDNAIKYSDPNKQISITGDKHDTLSVIEITDQGIGISPEDIDHIFDRFYRVDQSRTKTKVEGYGLGLSLAKLIISQHRGSITVDSEINKGSTFTIKLPNKS